MIKYFGKILPYALTGAISLSTLTGCSSVRINSNDIVYSTVSNEELESESNDEVPLDVEDKVDFNDPTIRDELLNVLSCRGPLIRNEEEYNNLLYPHLASTIDDGSAVYDVYYDKAKEIHLQECPLEHTVDEEGVINCEVISSNLDLLNDSSLFAGFLSENAKYMEDNDPIKVQVNRLLSSDVDFVECVNELENIYLLGMIPICLSDEEWNYYFSELSKTVSRFENIFDVYYDVACFAHGLKHDDEVHYINECDRLECESGINTLNLKYGN